MFDLLLSFIRISTTENIHFYNEKTTRMIFFINTVLQCTTVADPGICQQMDKRGRGGNI